tara:strand:+ start:3798 stop:4655 length:858 start_codon:yes stop_codon:yes gene_type:complete
MNKWIYIVLLVGLFAISTSPVIAKLLPLVPAVAIAFWRMATASAFLWAYSYIKPQPPIKSSNAKLVLIAGFLMAMHFIFWFGALKLTSIASTTILGIVAPAFTLIFERFYYKKRFNWATIFSLFIIFFGCVIVHSYGVGGLSSVGLGNIMAIISAIFLGGLFLLGSIIRKTTPVISYTRMLFTVSAGVLFIVSIILHLPLLGYSNIDYFWLLMLGLIPTLIGHTAFSYSVKFISPSVIAAIPLGEPIIASGLAWVLFSEKVPFNVIIGGIFIIAGLVLLIKNTKE